MTDFRAFCAEIIEKVEFTWGSGIPEDVKELLNRASSALADEPASVVSEPIDEEIMELWHGSDWYNEGATLREFLSIARAVLARWGNSAPLPLADGEVAGLVVQLREMAVALDNDWYHTSARLMREAAELLQRQASNPWKDTLLDALVCNFLLNSENKDDPKKALSDLIAWEKQLATDPLINPALQPVPISERLPGPEDCDAEGRCWVWWKNGVRWVLDEWTHHELREGPLSDYVSHWLPAHAIPIPTAND